MPGSRTLTKSYGRNVPHFPGLSLAKCILLPLISTKPSEGGRARTSLPVQPMYVCYFICYMPLRSRSTNGVLSLPFHFTIVIVIVILIMIVVHTRTYCCPGSMEHPIFMLSNYYVSHASAACHHLILSSSRSCSYPSSHMASK